VICPARTGQHDRGALALLGQRIAFGDREHAADLEQGEPVGETAVRRRGFQHGREQAAAHDDAVEGRGIGEPDVGRRLAVFGLQFRFRLRRRQPVADDLLQPEVGEGVLDSVLEGLLAVAALRRQHVAEHGRGDAVVAVDAAHLLDQVVLTFDVEAMVRDGDP